MISSQRGALRESSGPGDSAGELLAAAAAGSQRAWAAIVDRYSAPVWRVIRGFRFDRATSEDVAQFVWMQLLRNIDKIENPDRLAGWLGATARHEAINVYRARGRVVPADMGGGSSADVVWWDDDQVVQAEEQEAVTRALAALPDDMQELLRLMVCDPPLSYAEIAALLDRPVGSLGPSRARALHRLRVAYEAELGVKVS